MPHMPRFQQVVLPLLRAALPPEVKCGSWMEDIDYRDFPMINIKRIGGRRLPNHPMSLDVVSVEMSVYGIVDLPTTESLYSDALEALFTAVYKQTQTEAGYLHSIQENTGMIPLSSPFQDSWRVQGLIQIGVRPPRPS